jgi:hypothetical protein
MKFAMLYAAWDGEGWSTPIGVREELEKRGHEVQHYNLYHREGELNPLTNIRNYSTECLNKLKIDMLRGYEPDVLFLMDYGMFDSPLLDKSHFEHNCLWVMEAGDEPQSHAMQVQKAHKFDLILSPDRQCLNLYHTRGVHAIYWTHHADTKIFYPRPEIKPQWDCVTTCGGRQLRDGDTGDIKEALGDNFNNERYFYGNDHAERLCMGKMVFQCSQHKEVTRRIFEGMAVGRMVITDRLPLGTGLSEMFIDGEDIVYYDNAQDAIDKIKYYSEHEEEREIIAANGHKKVMELHTMSDRVDDMLLEIEKKV